MERYFNFKCGILSVKQYICIFFFFTGTYFIILVLLHRLRELKDTADERIQSFPLKRVFPLIISAMIQPTDQMSTKINTKGKKKASVRKPRNIHITKSVLSWALCSRNEERRHLCAREKKSWFMMREESTVLFMSRDAWWVIPSNERCKLARVAFCATSHFVDAVYKMKKKK